MIGNVALLGLGCVFIALTDIFIALEEYAR